MGNKMKRSGGKNNSDDSTKLDRKRRWTRMEYQMNSFLPNWINMADSLKKVGKKNVTCHTVVIFLSMFNLLLK